MKHGAFPQINVRRCPPNSAEDTERTQATPFVMPAFLLHFNASMCVSICLAELDALLSREGVPAAGVYTPAAARCAFPFVRARFSDEEEAARVLRGAVQLRHWYTLWTPWCSSLHGAVRALARAPPALIERACAADRTWRMYVAAERAKRLPNNASLAAIREHLRGAIHPAGRVELSDKCDTTIMMLLDFEPPQGAEEAADEQQDDAWWSNVGGAVEGDELAGHSLAPEVCAATGGLCSVGGDGGAGASLLAYRALIGVRHDTARHLVGEQALCRRPYLGPTSLEPEVGGVVRGCVAGS